MRTASPTGDPTTVRGRTQARSWMLVVLAVGLLGATPTWTHPSEDPSDTMPSTNANVFAMARIGDVLYIGGDFTSVGGRARSHLAAIDVRTGAVTDWDPGANREVWGLSAARDGGSVYATGKFGRVDGQRRPKVAEIDLAGRVTSWSPRIAGGRGTTVLATPDAVYVGGRFSSANGQSREYLAALDPVTGATLGFDAQLDQQVWDLEMAPDGRLWAAGNFRYVRGETVRGVAELDPVTGAPTAFRPAIRVATRDLVVGPSPDRVYVAAAGPGGRVIGYDTSTASGALLWSLHVDGDLQAIDATATRVFAGGHQAAYFGGSPSVHNTLAVDADTGDVAAWGVTTVNGKGAWEMLVTGEGLWVAGHFERIAGETHPGIAFFPS